MSTKKSSALEQALLEGQEILNVAKENAKELLAKHLQPEIEKMVKESIEDSSKEDDEENIITGEETDGDDDLDSDDDKSVEIGVEEPKEEIPGEVNFEEEPEVTDDAEDELDLTNASDEEVIKVFKKMKPEDDIVVTKNDDGNINLKTADDEYMLKLNEMKEETNENIEGQDDIIYEIDLSEDGGLSDEVIVDLDEYNEVVPADADLTPTTTLDMASREENLPYDDAQDEVIYEIELDGDEDMDEGARNHANLRLQGHARHQEFANADDRTRNGDPARELYMTETKNKNTKLITENESLKSDLGKYKEALRELRKNLNEVALFNQKLAHVNKLFCEHTTTKDEKRSIIKRFDTANTVDDAKSLYKLIGEELGSKATITESVETKINKTQAPATSIITESTSAKEDKQVSRIKELMNYTNKKAN